MWSDTENNKSHKENEQPSQFHALYEWFWVDMLRIRVFFCVEQFFQAFKNSHTSDLQLPHPVPAPVCFIMVPSSLAPFWMQERSFPALTPLQLQTAASSGRLVASLPPPLPMSNSSEAR